MVTVHQRIALCSLIVKSLARTQLALVTRKRGVQLLWKRTPVLDEELITNRACGWTNRAARAAGPAAYWSLRGLSPRSSSGLRYQCMMMPLANAAAAGCAGVERGIPRS